MALPQMPVYCRPQAFGLFAQSVAALATDRKALLRASVAIAQHELPEADPQRVEEVLDEWATIIRARTASGQERALLAHLHEFLFEEVGLAGNVDDYYNPLNSYIPAVLELRKGIPISLAMIYCEVGRRVGLLTEGINSPGHFLAQIQAAGDRMLVDVFARGRILTPQEAVKRIDQAVGIAIPSSENMFVPADGKQWLARMLQNLMHIFTERGQDSDQAAMGEMLALVA
jgi:regulator of sirC expression with transglutaminase-like and TPR domain